MPFVPSTLNNQPQRAESGRKISILKPATKRPLDDYEDNEENIKKTRREDEDFVDEDTAWRYTNSSGARSNKRQLEDFDYDEEEGQREKRARNASMEEEMDVDEDEDEGEDMLYDLEVSSSPEVFRGIKRHRAEDEGSVIDDGEAGTTKTRRKRRNKRTSDVNVTRSRKRDRDLEDEDMSEDDENTVSRRSLQKRGKTARRSQLISSKDSDTSSEIQIAGRAINETWKSHGVNYKIGPNGQKLRQVYMRKPATRFVMVSLHSSFIYFCSNHPLSSPRIPFILTAMLMYKFSSSTG